MSSLNKTETNHPRIIEINMVENQDKAADELLFTEISATDQRVTESILPPPPPPVPRVPSRLWGGVTCGGSTDMTAQTHTKHRATRKKMQTQTFELSEDNYRRPIIMK